MTREITVYGKPQGKARPRSGQHGFYTPTKTKEYEKKFAEAWRGKPKFEGALEVRIIACFEPPKSDSKRKRSLKLENTIKHTIKPDADNIAKAVLDGLNKVAFNDDSQIISLSVQKRYANTNFVIVEISEV